jgi:murein DD-endopeptidase MepM/ murein hydrolase activator NlpD
LKLKKRYYIMFVSRDEDGSLNKLPIPMHYAYIFVAAAVIGMFTITGLAGSYSRMLIKTARFNQLRQDHNALQKDYVHLEEAAREKDIQAASLGSLASEVSALYGLTASKLAMPVGRLTGRASKAHATAVAEAVANTPLTETASLSDDSYYKSVDAFYSLRSQALNGSAARALSSLNRPGFGLGSSLTGGGLSVMDQNVSSFAPNLWPVMGPITSSFGQRVDPVLGNGEGEFHKGLDISAANGTPIRATADGVVKAAEMENGYGRAVILDHGHGVETLYGHMSGFAVMAGQTVVRGQVIGYVGHSGRVTGNHVHYEVRIRNTPVNPHKYLRMTLAELGSEAPSLPSGTESTKSLGFEK